LRHVRRPGESAGIVCRIRRERLFDKASSPRLIPHSRTGLRRRDDAYGSRGPVEVAGTARVLGLQHRGPYTYG
jgi:hypothetical protein